MYFPIGNKNCCSTLSAWVPVAETPGVIEQTPPRLLCSAAAVIYSRRRPLLLSCIRASHFVKLCSRSLAVTGPLTANEKVHGAKGSQTGRHSGNCCRNDSNEAAQRRPISRDDFLTKPHVTLSQQSCQKDDNGQKKTEKKNFHVMFIKQKMRNKMQQ